MKEMQPTAQQIEELSVFGINDPPPCKNACMCLQKWIENGGEYKDERVAIINETQARFKGKKVKNTEDGRVGLFLYLTCRCHSSWDPRQDNSKRKKYIHPLDGYVKWSRTTSEVNIGFLEVVE